MRKVIAALLLRDRVGQVFDGLVTGVTDPPKAGAAVAPGEGPARSWESRSRG